MPRKTLKMGDEASRLLSYYWSSAMSSLPQDEHEESSTNDGHPPQTATHRDYLVDAAFAIATAVEDEDHHDDNTNTSS
jgi:hypothetical protein